LQVGGNATALLTGGTINFLTIGRYGTMTSSVTIDCKKDWEWLYTAGKVSGITGTWHNGTDFTIAFQNPPSPLLETWKSVHVIPEPASLVLIGLGGLLIRRRQRNNSQRASIDKKQ
ncbi:MAG: PEP-CTERM sorting domain-containing protein, partial [Planctomycetaceae bacterium]|nr:PEP-CTERM sorting domain-containing protein [Planctomycetaceae bacterium]